VCFLSWTDKPSFTATLNIYISIYFTFTCEISFKIKHSWKNSENVSSKCSLTGRVRATVPLLLKTTIDALLGGGHQQLQAACPSDNNARPFGQTVEYTVPCIPITSIQKCSYTDKNTDNKVEIQNVDTYKANQYNICILRRMSLGNKSKTAQSRGIVTRWVFGYALYLRRLHSLDKITNPDVRGTAWLFRVYPTPSCLQNSVSPLH
jgi:hypothetical protein